MLFFWRLLWYDETMKTAGITAEYNPFHKGHRYHIEKTREALEADCIIAVMSGNFTQRGEAAVMDKWTTATQSPYVSNFYDPSDHRPILADFELKQ